MMTLSGFCLIPNIFTHQDGQGENEDFQRNHPKEFYIGMSTECDYELFF